MEAAQNRPTFQTYLPNLTTEPATPTPLRRHGSFSNTHGSQGNLERRVSEPYSPDVRRKREQNTKRHSLLVDSKNGRETKEINRRSHDVTNMVKNLSLGWQQRSTFEFRLA